MGAFNWNKSQRDAIEWRGKNLILSAAAGSGKTATLTQRIIELILDVEEGADISEMLVLTFTNDAASELKERISKAISSALENDPSNKHLSRQMRNLEGASISTTHSFLINELRPHFMRFDLPPDFTVCDEAYVSELKRELMADTVNDFFDGVCTCEDFSLLADTLSGSKDDETLDGSLMGIWDDLMKLGLEPSFLKNNGNSGDFLLCGVGQFVADRIEMVARYYGRMFADFAKALSENEETAKNIPVARGLELTAGRLLDAAHKGYGAVRAVLRGFTAPSCKSVKSSFATDEYEEFKKQKEKFQKEIAKLQSQYFLADEAKLAETYETNCRVSSAVSCVLSEFERRFAAAKRERGKIDFNDVEKMAAALFCSENGEPTEAAIAVSKKYKHVFIDEYQDTNRLQDMIYTALSCSASRFMVGDVKQSVYQFRGARPENFVRYRKDYESGHGGDAIFMSENHRSDSGVIDFSNLVSDYMFPSSETPFEEEDRLVCAKKGGEGGALAEVVVVEEDRESGRGDIDYVCGRIADMIGRETLRDGTVVSPGHIAIIMRTGKLAAEYKKALEERGIPVKNGASESFFNYSEVLLLLSLLSAIDNPTSDIYLTAAMKSPVFGFSMEELVRLRSKDKLPLWYSVMRYAREESDPLAVRLRAFVQKMNGYRELSRSMLCDKFLYLLITDTGFNALRDDSGRGRLRASVKKMYSYAVSCASGGGGLHDFIIYLRGLMTQKESGEGKGGADAVTIVTAHRSKGLEYPICFLCDGMRQFNILDANKNAILDPFFGLYMKLPDPNGLVRCNTEFRRAAALALIARLKEEEMRVLYVALTRARERLIVVLGTEDAEKTLEASRLRTERGPSRFAVTSVECWGQWVLDAVSLAGTSPCFTLKSVISSQFEDEAAEFEETELDESKVSAVAEKFKNRFSFSYDREHLSSIPAKLSASKLSGDVLDRGYSSERTVPPMPSFLAGEKKVSAADMGTATHLFLQFCDFSALSGDVKEEAERLRVKGFISRETCDIIRFDEIEAFAKTKLFKSMLDAVEMYREVRFNHMLDASEFTENRELKARLAADETKICVQGVVDCLFTDSNGKTVLVDYKTDRLTEEELADKTLAAKKLSRRHRDQLLTYKRLCSEMLGRQIDQVVIYSLALGDTIELT